MGRASSRDNMCKMADGGLVGEAADALKNRGKRIDDAVDGSFKPASTDQNAKKAPPPPPAPEQKKPGFFDTLKTMWDRRG